MHLGRGMGDGARGWGQGMGPHPLDPSMGYGGHGCMRWMGAWGAWGAWLALEIAWHAWHAWMSERPHTLGP